MPHTPHIIVALDTETTGFSSRARVLQLGLVKLVDGVVTERKDIYANPFVETTYRRTLAQEKERHDTFLAAGKHEKAARTLWGEMQGAQAIHGLTPAFLSNYKPFHEYLPEFFDFIKDADHLLIQNAPFDLRMIGYELEKNAKPHYRRKGIIFHHDLPSKFERIIDPRFPKDKYRDPRIIDTLKIARSDHFADIKAKYGGLKLDHLCDYFGLANGNRDERHSAAEDAELTAQVLLKMIEACPEIKEEFIFTPDWEAMREEGPVFHLSGPSAFQDPAQALGWQAPDHRIPPERRWLPMLQHQQQNDPNDQDDVVQGISVRRPIRQHGA